MAVRGIGVDVVDVARFSAALERNERLAAALFTDAERRAPSGGARGAASLAARFAAKEAVAKSLGSPGGMRWHDCEVRVADSGAPTLAITGTVAAVAARVGISRWHLSLSHDGPIATAFVVGEGD
ncbi:holo-ACP synthase [Bowdeniella nasicola]|uniref:Holo-[acyl-carrier-protein] synthase n=1 Tax=Bowdeniella nasicola TaxID=208480 RepID=A0A1Q5Q5F3_9ACTO|nr:holo-ACP synthase [Bowdeniella nasicola]OKL55046.1 holo-ACP synthase [Bowdeniella nasicola]